jgi:hypothetical protein
MRLVLSIILVTGIPAAPALAAPAFATLQSSGQRTPRIVD